MYEHSLTNSLKNVVLSLCNQTGWRKVTRVIAKVGGLRSVNPELMSFIFAGLTKDTPAEGAILSVIMLPITLRCNSCGRIGIREEKNFTCPTCGSENIKILSGFELGIEAIEVESNFYNHE
ncbi:MAG: hydrogenase maturation nickel metallochaperone HypA [Synergistaceae bacterium]|nr:hydrogenase maturation nickel metallochaperone HypA [Synergistaceae bacterium]